MARWQQRRAVVKIKLHWRGCSIKSLIHIIKTFQSTADVRQIKTLLSKHFLKHLMDSRLTQRPRQYQAPNTEDSTIYGNHNPELDPQRQRQGFQTLPQHYREASDVWVTVSTLSQILFAPTDLLLWKNSATRTCVWSHSSRGSSGSCETSRWRLTRGELHMNSIWP